MFKRINLHWVMLTNTGGPTSRWSQSAAREIGNESDAHAAVFSRVLLPTYFKHNVAIQIITT